MNSSGSSSQDIADPQLAAFIEQENQKQRFQSIVHALAEKCWEICSLSTPSRLDGRSETCLHNCVERFIDSSNYIINKIGQEGAPASTSAPDMGLRAPEFFTDSDSTSSSSQQEKKSNWTF